MTDKKLTDEEIIDVLTKDLIATTSKYSAHLENGGKIDKNQELYIEMLTDSINFINSQKAEIERLKEYGSNLIAANMALSNRILEIKAEAYKEFANQIKIHKRRMRGFDLCYEFWDYAVLVEDIDNLLKEMVGEEE